MGTTVYPELYTKGTRVWIKHPTDVWYCAEIKENFDKNSGHLLLIPYYGNDGGYGDNKIDADVDDKDDENFKEKTLIIKDLLKDLPPLRNPDILIGSNDLTCLSYLHEPSVLYNLRIRFLKHQQIYTWCGIVLVAINPFTDLEIYGEDTIQMYHTNLANLAQMDPHIYAVAEDAFTKLERNNINQSVIVSGESGAGKTVSAKFAMRYFASIAGSDSNIETRVLASNPIMEAIGNAKTVRNDNSSRFGKYIQILFDRRNRHIMGGNMRTYLLEKSRVTYQGVGERNFHIFYQLCSYANQNRLDYLGLSNDQRQFVYLGSNEPTAYDDMTRFLEALDTLGFSAKQRDKLFAVIAAILHGGNIMFQRRQQDDDESCTLANRESLDSLQTFCRLLDLNESSTLKWLTSRLLKTGGHEIIATPLNAQMAQYGLEALLKFIYEKLFLWIVSMINQSLGPISTQQSIVKEYQFIGVLDIYGFEHFENNSFEQFCINYANEVLQQQFNWHVFKLEQDEYVREGIDWQFITFTDNQPVIDLIESKPIGILCLLDEECRMPQGNDRTWCSKLYKQITIGDVFKKPKFNFQTSFIIEHFADVVTYNVDGFLEKNRDTIWEEQIDLLKRSSVVECLFMDDKIVQTPPSTKGAGGKIRVSMPQSDQRRQKKKAKATIGFQFRESLEALMKILNSTEPHYVRCIKPNDNKAAFEFNNIRAVQQLRACGVLETIRISSNGYPSRWSYQDFANRYRVLRVGCCHAITTPTKTKSTDAKNVPKPTPRKLVRAGSSFAVEIRAICEDIVKIVYEDKIYSHFNLSDSSNEQQKTTTEQQQQQQQAERKPYQFGKTKIFFRPGQVALLERIRSQKLRECSILIQKMIRGWLQRKRYQRIRQAAVAIQKYGRGWLARRYYQHLRQTKAATIIQKHWRRNVQQCRYQTIRKSIMALQTRGRAYLARKRYENMRQNRAAITIQRYWRGYWVQKQYRDTRKKIIIAQSCVRRFLAKKEYRRLRIEARSVEHVTNLNKGLEKKIMTLQERIDDLIEENRLLKLTEGRYTTLRHEMEQMGMELTEIKTRQRQDHLQAQNYQSQIEKLITVNKELEQKVLRLEETKSELEERIRETLNDKKQMADNIEKIDEAIQKREHELREEFERERRILIAQCEEEKTSKQQLLSRYMDLEGKQIATVEQQRSVNQRLLNRFNGDEETNTNSLQSDRQEDFDSNLDRISIMMQCTELEQEMKKLLIENQKLREQIAKTIDDKVPTAAASLLSEQFEELQNELVRYKKERADLKRVILMEDHLTTFNGEPNQKAKHQEDLVATYKNLFAKLDEQIAIKDEMIRKLNNQNLYLKYSNKPLLLSSSIVPGHSNMDGNNLAINTNVDYNCDETKSLLGMFKFFAKDSSMINRILFYDFDPTNMNYASQCHSHTIAFIIYMCVRYADKIDYEKMAQDFMFNVITWIKKKSSLAASKNQTEILVHLLSTTFKIAILIKYYSEYYFEVAEQDAEQTKNSQTKTMDNIDSGFNDENKERKKTKTINGGQTIDADCEPNETDEAIESDYDRDYVQSLKNFDLTEYIKYLNELMVYMYFKIIKIFEDRILSLTVAAILEHQELSGMSLRQKRDENSDPDSGPPSPTEREIHTLFKELSNMQAIFRLHRLDEHFIYQFFKQIFYFIGMTALNNLMMRKDLCTNERAIEIIYNVSLFEQFLRENKIMNWDEVKSQMDPILQATKLLISTKTEKQIPAIVFTTQSLSIPQIIKIINMYTPSDEEHISRNFIKNLNKELQEQRLLKDGGTTQTETSTSYLMNTAREFPLYIPFIDKNFDNNISPLQATDLTCDLQKIDIPISLQRLERFLEKI